MGRKCQKGKPCGATCIERRDVCRKDFGSPISDRLAKVRGGLPKHNKKEQIRKLERKRERAVDSFHRLLSRDRGDGKGSHFENPNERSYRILRAFQNFTERLDSKLNRLEGREMVIAYDSQGNQFKHEPKRWYEDKHNMTRFKSLDTPARRDFLNRLAEDTLKGGTRSDEPRAIFMMGGPASGKSTLLKQMFGGDPKGFLVLDPDAIKAKLPEFIFSIGAGVKSAAAFSHETSSTLSKSLLDRAIGRRLNVLWDGTGSNKGYYGEKSAELKKLGYKTQLISQHMPKEMGVKRAIARAELPLSKGGGRFVPLHFIEEAYSKIPRNFQPLAKLFDVASISDSLTGRQIMKYENGKLIEEDKGPAKRFREQYYE